MNKMPKDNWLILFSWKPQINGIYFFLFIILLSKYTLQSTALGDACLLSSLHPDETQMT